MLPATSATPDASAETPARSRWRLNRSAAVEAERNPDAANATGVLHRPRSGHGDARLATAPPSVSPVVPAYNRRSRGLDCSSLAARTRKELDERLRAVEHP